MRTLLPVFILAAFAVRTAVIMHRILDPLARVSHEAVNRDIVATVGNSGYLVKASVDTYHGAFPTEHYLDALAAVGCWLFWESEFPEGVELQPFNPAV